MVKRLIGSDTTGTDGSVTIPYTGTGAGLVNLSVETEIDGSIVSETFNVIDALFYDDALTDTKWNTNYNSVNVNREIVSDGTRLYYSADSGTTYCNTVIGNTRNWFDSTKAYQIDFDFSFERADSNSAVGIGLGSTGFNLHNLFSSGLTGSGHLKIVTDGNTYQLYLDNVPKGTPLTITGNAGFFFLIYRTGSITFKNLTIIEI